MIKKPLLAALLLAPLASVIAKPIPENAQLEVGFQLPVIETTMYARPYVAVWIEDADRKPVRTVQLWVGKDEWLKDLRSWWRKVGRYDRELIDAVTSATRPAGEYKFVLGENAFSHVIAPTEETGAIQLNYKL
jgi:hypothetical protein